MVGLLGRVTEVQRRQKGENVCLQKSDKQFNEVHENHERHRKDSYGIYDELENSVKSMEENCFYDKMKTSLEI